MRIFWGLSQKGNKWDGGQILDPASGKTYKCSVEVQEGGRKLAVKGSMAFLSKTQTWVREP
jgi:uncharacterized protein (DUF2147 family)